MYRFDIFIRREHYFESILMGLFIRWCENNSIKETSAITGVGQNWGLGKQRQI